ncbi:MAG: cytochrome c peroxidase [Bacteroidota bacterium]
MKNQLILCLLILGLGLTACQKEENNGTAVDQALNQALDQLAGGKGSAFFQLPQSNDFNNIPQDPKNPLTAEKVALGKQLYHETGLALAPKMDVGRGTYSCASCHFASAGFQAGRHQGISDGGVGFGINGEGRTPHSDYSLDSLDVQPIRTPSAMNGAYQELMLWNGQFGATGDNVGTEDQWTDGTPKAVNHLGYEGLEIQAIAGLTVHRLVVDESILTDLGYKDQFDRVFADVNTADRYTAEYAGLAIAAYERTLMSNQAPFQEWLRGNYNALSEQEKRGALLFFTDGQCGSCHTGPALNSMDFYALGMKDLFENPEATYGADVGSSANLGRGDFTRRAEDMYKFKVPQLYNLSNSLFLGHGSSFRSIRDVVAYKNGAVAENPNVPSAQLASEFEPLQLSDEEIDDITAFISNALQDPNLMRYQPASVNSGNCIPNNDGVSQSDLGCQ